MFWFAGVLVLGALVSGAGATHSGIKRLSAGQINGNGAFNADFAGASADGTRVFFETDEKLVAADTDNAIDVYERTGSTTQRVSAGQVNGNGSIAANFLDASANGTRVLFETTESLVPEDSDGRIDIYERFGGTTTKVSIGNSSACCLDAHFQAASTDGTRVIFQTDENLTGDDTDVSSDVYERVGATTQRLSAGQINGNNETGSWAATFAGASADGTRVFFHSREQLVAGDTDGGDTDVYERFGGTTTKISPGSGTPPPDPTGGGAFYAGASADGTRVFFHTPERLVVGDTDHAQDLYELSSGGLARVSTGQVNGNGEIDANFDGASANGTRVFFHTEESLVSGDTDGWRDLYERVGGQTKRVSAGAINGNGNIVVNFKGASADGTRVFFHTEERLVSNDTGVAPTNDVYERASSQTSLVSLPPGGSFPATFAGASTNGSAVFYETNEQVKNDSDGSPDIYGVYLAP